MENASLPSSPIAKVRKKGWGRPRQPRAGGSRRAAGACYFYRHSTQAPGSWLQGKIKQPVSHTHSSPMDGFCRKGACTYLLRKKRHIPIKRILVVIPFELYICRYKYFIRGWGIHPVYHPQGCSWAWVSSRDTGLIDSIWVASFQKLWHAGSQWMWQACDRNELFNWHAQLPQNSKQSGAKMTQERIFFKR